MLGVPEWHSVFLLPSKAFPDGCYAMNPSVADILSAPECNWTPVKPPATEAEIRELMNSVPFEFPCEYLELLRFCNGGDGELDAAPLSFQMDSVAAAIEHNLFWKDEGQFEDYWFFGGNGGLEKIAFDLQSGPPYQVVMIDQIADEESAETIADNMSDFILKIGHTAQP